MSSGIQEPRLGQGSGLRSHALVKHYPRQLSAIGNTSQTPSPVGESCSTAFAEGPEGASLGEDGAGALLGDGGLGETQVTPGEDAPGSEEGGEGCQAESIPCSVPAGLL